MARFAVLFVLCGSVVALKDVPKGECYNCEVTCFEDCALKYDREIIQTDVLLQTGKHEQNRTVELTNAYGKCLIDDQCPCRAGESKASDKKALQLVDKKKGKCATNAVPCSAKCAQKALAPTDTKSKMSLLSDFAKSFNKDKKEFPLHAVKLNVFAKGGMLMDQCLKYCLAATCGCEDAPGFAKREKTVKANAAAGPAVHDGPAAPQFKPAKIEECAKGMIGKKVVKGMYVDFGGGVGGELEVCKKKFMERVFGPGDHKKKEKLCASQKSEDSKWGCIWNEKKGYCMVGFSPNLRCQIRYIDDPSRL